jgi:hypothetical protein
MKSFKQQAKEYVQNHPSCAHLKKLSFGCAVLWGDNHEYPARYISKVSSGSDGESRIQETVLNQNKVIKTESLKIIGHEPTGFDYLKVLKIRDIFILDGRMIVETWNYDDGGIHLSLTGEPLDEENARLFMEIVGS